jgi:hypothetical protein
LACPNLMPFGQEPECGHETALFSGRTIYVIGSLHLLAVHALFDHLVPVFYRFMGLLLPVSGADATDVRRESMAVILRFCCRPWLGACAVRTSRPLV